MTYIYNETGDERIWEDIPKPEWWVDDAEWKPAYAAYNSRPSYPVSDELKKKWVKGQKVGDRDFKLHLQYLSYDEKTWINSSYQTEGQLRYIKRPYRTAAIPLPEQSKPTCIEQELWERICG